MGEEKTYEHKIKTFLTNEGAWNVKFFANGHTRSGVPDLLCCVNGYFVAVEVKASKGHASPLQIYQCNRIREAEGLHLSYIPQGLKSLRSLFMG